jgi:putative oxidoreductase
VSSNPVYAFFATPKSFGPLILRALLATIFIYHGGQKAFGLFGGDGWSGTLKNFSGEGGMGFPVAVAALVMITEVMAAIAMVFGFLTRLAAFGVVVVMSGALYFVHAGQGWAKCEFPFAVLMVGIALVFLGGGRLSIDRMISGQLLPTIGGY